MIIFSLKKKRAFKLILKQALAQSFNRKQIGITLKSKIKNKLKYFKNKKMK